MTITEVKARVDQLGSAWEQFKSVNESRLNEIEKRGNADPLTDQHLSRVSSSLDECKNRLNKMEVAMNRPSLSADGDVYVGDTMVQAHKQAFSNYLRKGVEGAFGGF